jgi:hypothetical protein
MLSPCHLSKINIHNTSGVLTYESLLLTCKLITHSLQMPQSYSHITNITNIIGKYSFVNRTIKKAGTNYLKAY